MGDAELQKKAMPRVSKETVAIEVTSRIIKGVSILRPKRDASGKVMKDKQGKVIREAFSLRSFIGGGGGTVRTAVESQAGNLTSFLTRKGVKIEKGGKTGGGEVSEVGFEFGELIQYRGKKPKGYVKFIIERRDDFIKTPAEIEQLESNVQAAAKRLEEMIYKKYGAYGFDPKDKTKASVLVTSEIKRKKGVFVQPITVNGKSKKIKVPVYRITIAFKITKKLPYKTEVNQTIKTGAVMKELVPKRTLKV